MCTSHLLRSGSLLHSAHAGRMQSNWMQLANKDDDWVSSGLTRVQLKREHDYGNGVIHQQLVLPAGSGARLSAIVIVGFMTGIIAGIANKLQLPN